MLFVLCCLDTLSKTASDDSLRELSVQMWINSECFANPFSNDQNYDFDAQKNQMIGISGSVIKNMGHAQ